MKASDMLILYYSIDSNLILREKELYWAPYEKLHLLAYCVLMKNNYLVLSPFPGTGLMHLTRAPGWRVSLVAAEVVGASRQPQSWGWDPETKPGFQGWNVQPQPQPTRRRGAIEIKSPAIRRWIQWITPM